MSWGTVAVVPVALPLLAAGVAMVLYRWRMAQRLLGAASLAGIVAAAVALLVHVHDAGTVVVQIGDWPAPFGITLVVDLFAAIMLTVSTTMLFAVWGYAVGSPTSNDAHTFFHPVYLVLAAGVSLAFITGDLFNLFVAFEITLTASYVLITLGGGRDQIRSGMTYVVISLTASMLFLTSVAFLYAATGTVNMAQLSQRIAELPDGTRTALGLLLIVVFGIKAAIFPLFFWLPDSYPTAPTPVTAIFAGLLTKVGVYAIVRTQTLLFPTGGEASTVLLWIAALTMVVGVLGAIAQSDVKRILSFHIVNQIGYMIFGLALFTVAGLAGAVFYVVHHIIVKTGLFLVAGLVEATAGSALIKKVGGVLHKAPVVAVLFAVPALSLAGLPPFSGFVAKLSLVEAGADVGSWVVVGVSLLVSLLTLFSMTKIWGGVFWGEVEGPDFAGVEGTVRPPVLMVASTAVVVLLSIGVALWAGPLLDLATQAGEGLADPASYVRAVLP